MVGGVNGQGGLDLADRARSLIDRLQDGVESAADSLGLGETLSKLERLLASPSPLDRFLNGPQTEAPATATPRAEPTAYQVRAGDTLTAIAARSGVSVDALARANGIANPDRIGVGQQLRIPGGEAAPASYQVRSGDTLSGIAAQNGTTVSALTRANGIADPDRIAVGQQLRLPGAVTGTTTAAVSVAAESGQAGATHRLGGLSEVYESGNRGPGTVSSGTNDPGGVSYGIYQLSTNAGTLRSFLRNEGAQWSAELGAAPPGTRAFSDQWRSIAAREPDAFRDAQHGFIERTHYRPLITAVSGRTGLDLDSRADAVRDAAWSVSVQHAGGATIINRAVAATDRQVARDDAGYDRALINGIYRERTAYVLDVARTNPRLSAGQRDQLVEITRERYPAELRDALRMLDAPRGVPARPTETSSPPRTGQTEAENSIDGNTVAREHGVSIKSDAVRLTRLDPAMRPVIAAVAQAGRELELPQPVITSGNDSRHRSNSLHYENRALDFRGNNVSLADGQRLETRVRDILGPGYDIDFETFANSSNNHLHVEYDPR